MEKLQAVLLNVWREACRHIEISESTEAITSLLLKHLPIDQLLVRRIDRPRSSIARRFWATATAWQSLRHWEVTRNAQSRSAPTTRVLSRRDQRPRSRH